MTTARETCEIELEEWAAVLLSLHELREAPGDLRPVRIECGAEKLLDQDAFVPHGGLQHSMDPPEQQLTREKAEQWIDCESLNQRWHTGWLEEQPEKPVKVFPDPDSYIGSRDLDAASAVWAALRRLARPLDAIGARRGRS